MFGEEESESPRVPSPWESIIELSRSGTPVQGPPPSLLGELERRSYPSIPHPHSPSISPPSFTKSATIPTFIPSLPPENDYGSIEYKLCLLHPSPARFTRLVTQLKWRLLEGGGRALYELGVGDDGELVGLGRKDMEETIGVLSEMAGELGARVWVVRQIRLGHVEGTRTVARDIPGPLTVETLDFGTDAASVLGDLHIYDVSKPKPVDLVKARIRTGATVSSSFSHILASPLYDSGGLFDSLGSGLDVSAGAKHYHKVRKERKEKGRKKYELNRQILGLGSNLTNADHTHAEDGTNGAKGNQHLLNGVKGMLTRIQTRNHGHLHNASSLHSNSYHTDSSRSAHPFDIPSPRTAVCDIDNIQTQPMKDQAGNDRVSSPINTVKATRGGRKARATRREARDTRRAEKAKVEKSQTVGYEHSADHRANSIDGLVLSVDALTVHVGIDNVTVPTSPDITAQRRMGGATDARPDDGVVRVGAELQLDSRSNLASGELRSNPQTIEQQNHQPHASEPNGVGITHNADRRTETAKKKGSEDAAIGKDEDEPRLIIEALVVRQFANGETFLDFEGFGGPMRGSRIDVFYGTGPQSAAGDSSLPALSSLDSAFQLQEYISLVIRKDVHNVDRIVSIPILPGKEDGKGVDENCWIYEQLRRLAQDLTHPLITALQTECTRQTCPQMKAGEWLYLCVAHGNESTSFSSSSSDTGLPGGGMVEQCCAIDYILHTIDSATALLNSPRTFPSRLSIPTPSVRHFSSLARRLGRVFAHAYFHHRELFEQAEAESSLYRRFEEMVGRWSLVPKEFLVIPTLGKDNDTSRDGYARGRDDAGMTASEPKLEAAAVNLDVHLGLDEEGEREDSLQGKAVNAILDNGGAGPGQANASVPLLDSGFSSPAGTGRKPGRTRTDTMVLSDASTFVDELSKSPGGRAQVELAEASESDATPAPAAVDPIIIESSNPPPSLSESQPPELSSEETPAASSESSSEEESSESPAETTTSKPEEVPTPIEPVVPVPEEPEIVAEEEEKQEHVEPEVTPSSSTAPSDSAPVDMKIEVAGEEVDGDDGEVQEEASASLPSDIKEEDKTPAVELDTAKDKKDSSEVEQTSEESQISEPTMEAPASSTEPAVSENVDTTDSLEEKNDTNEESEGDVQAKGEVGVTHEAKDAEVVGEAEEVASKGADGAEEEE
ncbi:hypothetical protein F5878DRAFT_677463 [Lentinula raphanica]|uniref:Mob1 phocein n=1 Tax=Lentinula raphanica TaxID=153919 RepID=A0AA38UIK4_9AGAR|nr:hypothetical protein F5878DRAFT_677463 [Lentinula raphanica]